MRKIRNDTRLAILLVLALPGGPAIPQAQPDLRRPDNIQKLPDKAVLDAFRPLIRNALTETDRKVFDEIAFQFPDTVNYLQVHAFMRDGKRHVEISQGFLHVLLALTTAYYQQLLLTPKKSLSSYFSYLKANVGTAAARFEQGKGPLPTFVAFHVWAEIPPKEALEVAERKRTDILRDHAAGFLTVILHETAHHINNDVTADRTRLTDQQLRDQEYLADMFAITTMQKMGITTSGLDPYFLYAAILAGNVNGMYGDHDPAICRLALFNDTPTEEARKLQRDILARCNRVGPAPKPAATPRPAAKPPTKPSQPSRE